MVWGCFSYYGPGPLVQVFGNMNSEDYTEVLHDCLIPFLDGLDSIVGEKNYLFQSDNATIHTSTFTTDWLEENDIDELPWPATSPDLNPIEHLWDELERRICKHNPLPSSESELFSFLQEEWFKIDGSIFKNLVESMPRRVRAVIDAKEYPTRY